MKHDKKQKNCTPVPKQVHTSRRNFISGALASSASALAFSLSSTAKATTPICPAGGMVAWQQPDNNNALIALQKQGKSAAQVPGNVSLDYFGHCAFRVTSPRGVSLMFDPWRNDPSGYWGIWYPKDFPKTKVDIGLSTHAHFDHDALDKIEATMLLDRMVGEFELADVKITGIADKHACSAPGWYKWTDAIKEFGQSPCPPNNPHHMDMSMYVVETGGLRIAMWGDNRHNPSAEALQLLGKIDVLTLPVDGSQHIFSYEQANSIVSQLNPHVVIPTHYLCEGVSITLTTLQTADAWVKQQKNKQMLSSSQLSLHPANVKKMRQEFMYFGSHTAV